jgi:hypothetical protein
VNKKKVAVRNVSPLNLDHEKMHLCQSVYIGSIDEDEQLSTMLRELHCGDETHRDRIKRFFRSKNQPAIWFHNGTPYTLQCFRNFIYYQDMDYRPHIPYKRVSNQVYLSDGKLAEENKAAVNGVKGRWAFGRLSYVDVEFQINWDPFHTLMNVSKGIFNLLFGKRLFNLKTVQFCKKHNMFPHFWENVLIKAEEESKVNKTTEADIENESSEAKKNTKQEYLNPWALSSVTDSFINKMQTCFDKVILPRGLTGQYALSKLFTQFGYVKGKAKIDIMTCSMDYMTYVIAHLDKDIARAYLHLYRMISSLFASLLAPCFIDAEIDKLYWRTVEVLELYSSMFPPSETLMIHHQLIDIVPYIKKHGPLRCWWSLPSERAMSKIKKSVPMGGLSFDKTVADRVFTEELGTLMQYYNNLEKTSCSDSCSFKVPDKASSYSANKITAPEYDDFAFHLDNTDDARYASGRKHQQQLQLYFYERVRFVDFLVHETRRIIASKHCNIRDPKHLNQTICSASNLYRLHTFFLNHRKTVCFNIFDGEKQVERFCKDNELAIWIDNFDHSFALLAEYAYPSFDDIPKNVSKANLKKFILRSDLDMVETWKHYINGRHDYFDRAFIWGTKFQSRYKGGMNLPSRKDSVSDWKTDKNPPGGSREYECPIKKPIIDTFNNVCDFTLSPCNSLNDLSNCLQHEDRLDLDFSSWCRVHSYANPGQVKYFSRSGDIDVPSDFALAQINYYFVISLPPDLVNEPVMHLPVASIQPHITKRVTEIVVEDETSLQCENLWQIDCLNNSSFDATANAFAGLYNIYATPIAVVPCGATGSPSSKPDLPDGRPSTLLLYALDRGKECLHNGEMLKRSHPYHNETQLQMIRNTFKELVLSMQRSS